MVHSLASTSDDATPGPRRLRGACLCRTVEYVVADAFRYAVNCHCSNCRRSTGAAFKPLAGIESSRFEVTAGKDAMMFYGTEPAHDAHCGRCGSLLYCLVKDGTFVHIPMGTLVDEPSIRPTAHIFVGSKAKWFDITDDLPQFEEFADGAA